MLHIVNGDSVGEKLKQGGIEGDILVWREVYTAGPVFRDLDAPRSLAVRAAFMEQAFGVPADEYRSISEAQELSLRDAGKYDEIALWFEYDLYDQTMLCRLLYSLSLLGLGDTKLNLLQLDSFPGVPDFRGLGQLSVQQLMALAGTWKRIGREELELGRKIWEHYTSPDMEDHIELLRIESTKLLYIRQAMENHLSRLPSVHNGLSIIEQATLEAAVEGASTPHELFAAVSSHLHTLGLGDLEYWYRLKKLTQGPEPLLLTDRAVDFPSYQLQVPEFGQAVFRLTEQGRRTLSGEVDWTASRQIDEWVGGYHRTSGSPWRWDPTLREVVRSE